VVRCLGIIGGCVAADFVRKLLARCGGALLREHRFLAACVEI
jgi:hypothetical protein